MSVLNNPRYSKAVCPILEGALATFNLAVQVIEGQKTLGLKEAHELFHKCFNFASGLWEWKESDSVYLTYQILEIVVNLTVAELKSSKVTEEMELFMHDLTGDLATRSRHGCMLRDGERRKLVELLLDGILYIKEREIRERLFLEVSYRLIENTDENGKTVVDQKERKDILRRHNMTNAWLFRGEGWNE